MKNNNTPESNSQADDQEKKFPGYPPYPKGEDIYNQLEKADNIDPENPSEEKASSDENGKTNEKNFPETVNGDDLDIPGSELDDEQEEVGSEDEENNYYSLGGDNHEDLEETHEDL